MQEMRELCDHVAIINKGELVKVGPVEEVTGASYSLMCTLSRELSAEEYQKIKGIEGVESVIHPTGTEYSLNFAPSLSPENVDQALKIYFKLLAEFGVIMRSMTEKNKLEDEYLRLTGQ